MSGEMQFALIITEGPHDSEAIKRIMNLKGFSELRKIDQIPPVLRAMIPQRYPFDKEGNLTWGVPRPLFLKQDNKLLVIINAGGKDQLGSKLADSFETLHESSLFSLAGIAVISDMDNGNLEQRRNELLNQLKQAFENDADIESAEELTGFIVTEEVRIPLLLFFFPDNKSQGTLEMVLLDGAENSYPELFENAHNYIEKAQEVITFKNYDHLKSTVGVIANVLKPGKANQVSIGENNWFTKESIEHISSHKLLAEFLESLTSLMR